MAVCTQLALMIEKAGWLYAGQAGQLTSGLSTSSSCDAGLAGGRGADAVLQPNAQVASISRDG